MKNEKKILAATGAALIIGLAFWFVLISLIVSMSGCSVSKRTKFKNHCNVKMVG